MPIVQDTVKDDSGREVTIYIEVDEQTAARDPYRNTRGVTDQAREAFEGAMELIHTCAEKIAHAVQTVPENIRPKGFEVQFAVKIDAELGAIIAKTSGEAQIQVTMRWGEKD